MSKFNLLEKIWCEYGDDVGKALIHLGAAGWFFSAAAQVGMIKKNKEFNQKEKRFLLHQEIADGVINVTLYYTICQSIKKFGEYIVENAHLATRTTAKTILKMKAVPSKSITEFIRGMAESFRAFELVKTKKSTKNLSDFFNGAIAYIKEKNPSAVKKFNDQYPNILNPLNRLLEKKTKEEVLNILQDAQKNFNSFKNGIGVIAAVGASILACNIITPYTRNITANYFEKKKERFEKRNAKISAPAAYCIPVSQTFDKFKI